MKNKRRVTELAKEYAALGGMSCDSKEALKLHFKLVDYCERNPEYFDLVRSIVGYDFDY